MLETFLVGVLWLFGAIILFLFSTLKMHVKNIEELDNQTKDEVYDILQYFLEKNEKKKMLNGFEMLALIFAMFSIPVYFYGFFWSAIFSGLMGFYILFFNEKIMKAAKEHKNVK